LRTSRYYPAPFAFQRRRTDVPRRLATDLYDLAKVRVLQRFLLKKRSEGAHFVFVSDWMRNEFLNCMPDGRRIIDQRDSVIPNAVHESFARRRYRRPERPLGDFATFRPNTDVPKYAIDVVVELARRFPQYTFDVYGRGQLTEILKAPANLHHLDRPVAQSELCDLADRYRAALIPSRLDAQGVTACEMATFGIPTIVSDLPVARQFLGDFENVRFIDPEFARFDRDARELWAQPLPPLRRDYLPETTCAQELGLFNAMKARSLPAS